MEKRFLSPFRAAVAQHPLVPTWWDPQQAAQLGGYLQRAQACLDADDPVGAVECWRAALTRLPDLPGPRKRWLQARIRDTLLDEARRASDPTINNLSAAEQCLRLALETKVADGDTLKYLGLVVHLNGRPVEALDHYRHAHSLLTGDEDLPYALRLAHLQLALPAPGSPDRPAEAVPSGKEATRPGEGFSLGDPHHHKQLRAVAWERLAALEAVLLQGDVHGALRRFPGPDHPYLPSGWALEGALLAVFARDWPLALRYFDAAKNRGWEPPLHPYASLYEATLLQIVQEKDDHIPRELREKARRLLAAQPQSSPTPAGDVAPDAFPGLQTHRRQLAAWQRLHRLVQLHKLVNAGNWSEVGPLLAEALSWPSDWPPNQTHLRAWLACHDNDGTRASQLLREARGKGDESIQPNLLRLSAWVAEHIGPPQEVVAELNRLLDPFPRDEWGLERWKYWMLRLGRAAMGKGHFQQALLHFASLLLRLPEDPDGWLWCARANERLGNRQRARECYRQARRFHNPSESERKGETSGEAVRNRAAGRLLELLLKEALLSPLPAAVFPFTQEEVRDLLTASVRRCDLYLLSLVHKWAAAQPSSSAFKAGCSS